tara:strand:- start:20165 stop:20386 length:222 start_codon:yes stop_codon:yes gene_type:complete
MLDPMFDPFDQLNKCQTELLRQGRLLSSLVKQQESIADLQIQTNQAFVDVQKKFNQVLRELNELKVKIALIEQ